PHPSVLHSERDAGRGLVGAVQHVDDVLWPVLRSWPRSGDKGWRRDGLRAAAAEQPAVQYGPRRAELTEGDTGYRYHAARLRWQPGHGGRHQRERIPHHTVCRSEPDLHLASGAPGVSARL